MKAQLALIRKETLLILAGVLVAFYALMLSVAIKTDTQGGLPKGPNNSIYSTK